MNLTERFRFIKKCLSEKNVITISELKSELGVSEITIRKDLEQLEKEGALKRFRGGAILTETISQKRPSQSIDNYESKQIISELAMDLLQKGDSIFLGSGSTCYVLGTMLKPKQSVSVITNNASAAVEMTDNTVNSVLIGGELLTVNGICYTSRIESFESYGELSVNHAFLGIDGIDRSVGFTTNYLYSVNVHQYIPHIARQLVILADHTKFDKRCLVQAFGTLLPDCVISDCYMPEYDDYFKSKNIQYIHP